MVKIIIRIGFVLLLSAVVQTAVFAVTITVTTDRAPVSIDESFQLVFEADGKVDDDPDFTPLNRSFQILSSSHSSNFSVVNGQIKSARRWTLTVIAKETGKVAIPPISFGLDNSPAEQIEVTESSGASTDDQQENNDIFLEASVSKRNPYVQSQVIFKLKLFRSVPIARASLTDPEITKGNAVIERIDDDNSYERSINGRNYYVIERNFAVYPQASGEVIISPVTFMGQVTRNPYSYDPFSRQPRTIVRRSEDITLDVSRIPAEFSHQNWLPAENLTIAEEWSADPLKLRVGEPVTRTLILDAKALTASQLPELPGSEIDDLKFYPERPELTNNRVSAGIAGIRKEKAAIIPAEAGDYTLPEISIPWWNTLTDKLEYAVLPRRTIRVQAGGNISSTEPDPSLQGAMDSIQVTPDQNTGPSLDPAQASESITTTDIWKYISLVLLLVWLFTLFRNRRSASVVNYSEGDFNGINTVKAARKAVTASCRQGDAFATRKNMLHWASLVWPESPPPTLGKLAECTGPQLSAELNKLNSVVYGKDMDNWDGETFLSAFLNEALPAPYKSANRSNDEGKLEPLYRIR